MASEGVREVSNVYWLMGTTITSQSLLKLFVTGILEFPVDNMTSYYTVNLNKLKKNVNRIALI